MNIVVRNSKRFSETKSMDLFELSPLNVNRLVIPSPVVIFGWSESPMNVKEIKLLDLKVLKGLFDSLKSICCSKGENLWYNENVLTFVLSFSEDCLQSISNNLLVSVENSSVDVTIAKIKGASNEVSHFFFIGWLPSTKTKDW